MKIGSAYIEITNRCNLNCADCYNASGLNKSTSEISAEELDLFISTLEENSVRDGIPLNISFSGGEPLMHSEFNKITDIIQKHTEKGTRVVVVTNSTLRNEKFYSQLESNQNLYVQFSLDGINEETNSVIRGAGNFEKSIKNIESVKSYANPPIIKMVIAGHNFLQVEEYYRYFVQKGFHVAFSFVGHMGNAVSNWDTLSISPQQKIDVLKKIRLLDEEFDQNSHLPYATVSCPLLAPDPTFNILVKPDGSIHPCQTFYNKWACIGNIHNFNETDIQEKANKILSILEERTKMDFGCKKCINGSYCQKGCPAAAVNLHGNLNSDDGNCMLRKLQFLKLSVLSNKDSEEKTCM